MLLEIYHYFWRVTGNPLQMPYQLARESYAVAPYMIWQPLRPEPAYHYEVLRKMYAGAEAHDYFLSRSLLGVIVKAVMAWRFYLGVALSLPRAALALTLARGFSVRKISSATASLLFVLSAVMIAAILSTFYNPHYYAPATGVVLALVLMAMRQMRNWNPGGLFLGASGGGDLPIGIRIPPGSPATPHSAEPICIRVVSDWTAPIRQGSDFGGTGANSRQAPGHRALQPAA
jgi:hypothetical protein